MSLKLKGDSAPTYISFNFPTVHKVSLPIRFTCFVCGGVIDFASVSNPNNLGAYDVKLYTHICKRDEV